MKILPIKDPVKINNFKALLEALRSDKFTQIKGHLCGEEMERCIVGIMCELYPHGYWSEHLSEGQRAYIHDHEMPEESNIYCQAPREVFEFFGFQLITEEHDQGLPCVHYSSNAYWSGLYSITFLNDAADLSFGNLANLLETNYITGIADEDTNEHRPRALLTS